MPDGIEGFATKALEGAASELGAKLIDSIFGGDNSVTLSQESLDRIRDIVKDVWAQR